MWLVMDSTPTIQLTIVPTRKRPYEGGFGVVEVVIAAILLMVVVSAVVLATTGGAKLRGSARLQASLTQAGKNLQEDLITDTGWMESCALPSCDVATHLTDKSKRLEDVDGSVVIGRAQAVPVDSPVDGLAQADSDGTIPDYYRITIELQPDADVIKRYGGTASSFKRRFVTSVDPKGTMLEGSLRVDACAVENQVDERMSIQGCKPSGLTELRMGPCTASPRPGCVSAYDWAASGSGTASPSVSVAMRRVPADKLTFSIVNTATGTRTESTAAGVYIKDESYVFPNLDAGEYRIEGLPDTYNGLARWKSKEAPSFHGSDSEPNTNGSVSVEPGLKNHALVLFRPTATGKGIRFQFERLTKVRRYPGLATADELAISNLPTNSYQGGAADEYCVLITEKYAAETSDYMVVKCVLSDAPPNCKKVYVEYAHKEGADSLMGNISKVHSFCTFYTRTLRHYYYKPLAPIDWIRAGAVKTAVYTMEPKPDAREVVKGQLPVEVCIVRGHGATGGATSTCSSKASIDNLLPGLNSSVQVPPDAISGESNVANHKANSNISGTPAWLSSPGLWVQRDGSIVSASGTVGPNPTVSLRGVGECYWWDSPYFPDQRLEGPCDPCTPLWKPGEVLLNACAGILVKTCWTMSAAERTSFGDEYGLGVAKGCLPPYDKAWTCNVAPISIMNGNCRPRSAPPLIERTTFTTEGEGAAIINAAPVNTTPTEA